MKLKLNSNGDIPNYVKEFDYLEPVNNLYDWIEQLNMRIKDIEGIELIKPYGKELGLPNEPYKAIRELLEYGFGDISILQKRYYIYKPHGLLFEKYVAKEYGLEKASYYVDYTYKIDLIDKQRKIGYYVKSSDKALKLNITTDLPYLRAGMNELKLREIKAITMENIYNIL